MIIKTMSLWEDRKDVKLTSFIQPPDPFLTNPVKKPAIIVCPGGAYMICPRHGTEGDTVAMNFAADGFHSFVLEYSATMTAPEGKALFPAQLLDLGKAILTIKEKEEEWGIDTDKISIIGFSAGANLCGMLATTWHEKLLSETFHKEPEYFRPLSAILIYGLLDYVNQHEFNIKNPSPMLPPDLDDKTFGENPPSFEKLKAQSPLYHVSEHTCPIFMAAASDDSMVPPIQSIKMAEKLQEAGVPYELHMFRFGEHGFALGRNSSEPYRYDLEKSSVKWVPLAKTFLMYQLEESCCEKEKSSFGDAFQ